MDRKLILNSGVEFIGKAFGATTECVSTLVYNSSMVGYQELISDPEYYNRILLLSYPLVGNYGITDDDYEAKSLTIKGLIVREYNDKPSNFRYTKTLAEVLEDAHIPGIAAIDTRMLMRILRDQGPQKALITDCKTTLKQGLQILEKTEVPSYAVPNKKRWYSRTANPQFSVAVVDYGVALSLIRSLNQKGCNVTIIPDDTKINDILALSADGVIFAGGYHENGNNIGLIKALQGKLPILGYGNAHLKIAQANNCKVKSYKLGYHGSNYPVRNTKSGKVFVSAQKNDFYVVKDNKSPIVVTYENVLYKSIVGLKILKDHVISSQFISEEAGVLDDFIALMSDFKKEVQ